MDWSQIMELYSRSRSKTSRLRLQHVVLVEGKSNGRVKNLLTTSITKASIRTNPRVTARPQSSWMSGTKRDKVAEGQTDMKMPVSFTLSVTDECRTCI